MTDCRGAAGMPMDSTVGRGEAIGIPAAALRHAKGQIPSIESMSAGPADRVVCESCNRR